MDHKTYFEVLYGSGREQAFPTQSDAMRFAQMWNGLYQVVYYIFEKGERVRKVVKETQY